MTSYDVTSYDVLMCSSSLPALANKYGHEFGMPRHTNVSEFRAPYIEYIRINRHGFLVPIVCKKLCYDGQRPMTELPIYTLKNHIYREFVGMECSSLEAIRASTTIGAHYVHLEGNLLKYSTLYDEGLTGGPPMHSGDLIMEAVNYLKTRSDEHLFKQYELIYCNIPAYVNDYSLFGNAIVKKVRDWPDWPDFERPQLFRNLIRSVREWSPETGFMY